MLESNNKEGKKKKNSKIVTALKGFWAYITVIDWLIFIFSNDICCDNNAEFSIFTPLPTMKFFFSYFLLKLKMVRKLPRRFFISNG